MRINRRDFLKKTGQGALAVAAAGSLTNLSSTAFSTEESTKKTGSQ